MNQRALATSSRATSMPLSSSVRSDTRFPKHPPGKCLAMLCGVYDSHVSVSQWARWNYCPQSVHGVLACRVTFAMRPVHRSAIDYICPYFGTLHGSPRLGHLRNPLKEELNDEPEIYRGWTGGRASCRWRCQQ